jgi:Domain of unknown function (DU1801)
MATKTTPIKKHATEKPVIKKPVAKKKIATAKVAVKKSPQKTTAAAKPAAKKTYDAGNKTVASSASPTDFIASLADPVQRTDAEKIAALFSKITKAPAKMWGANIIGFGDRKLVHASGRSMDWMLIAFAPRKANTVLYIMDGFPQYPDLLATLGKYKMGKSCLYLNKLADINMSVLEEMVERSVKAIKAKP